MLSPNDLTQNSGNYRKSKRVVEKFTIFYMIEVVFYFYIYSKNYKNYVLLCLIIYFKLRLAFMFK